jgi:homoserine acetyltransferase
MNRADPRDFLASTDARMLEVMSPSSDYIDIPDSDPLRLDCDKLLAPLRIAYKTYGSSMPTNPNAILDRHALTATSTCQRATRDRQALAGGSP